MSSNLVLPVDQRRPCGWARYARRDAIVEGRRTSIAIHIQVWEAANGSVPEGFTLHHLNGDARDNRVENLGQVTPEEHRRIHCGWTRREDGTWLKPCSGCRSAKPPTEFYSKSRGGFSAQCRDCAKARSRAVHRLIDRRARAIRRYLRVGWQIGPNGILLKPCQRCRRKLPLEQYFLPQKDGKPGRLCADCLRERASEAAGAAMVRSLT